MFIQPRKKPIASVAAIIAASTALLCLLSLSGCDGQRKSPDKVLKAETQTIERRAKGCDVDDEGCASVTISREVFAERPALNEAVAQQLARQLQGYGEEQATAGSLEEAADRFLEEAQGVPGESGTSWQLTGDAKRLGRRGDLLTMAIDSYAYTGGAHGIPISSWFNWDLAADKPVKLKDVIAEGKEDEFWQRARAAHRRWLKEKAEADKDFQRNWPFQRSEDFHLDDKGLTLLYNVYTLGPYVFGQVELTVPTEELQGILHQSYQ